MPFRCHAAAPSATSQPDVILTLARWRRPVVVEGRLAMDGRTERWKVLGRLVNARTWRLYYSALSHRSGGTGVVPGGRRHPK